METPKLTVASLAKAVTYPACSENYKNTVHGIGPKGNVLLKIDGRKKTGCGILLQQQSSATQDGLCEYHNAISHVSPTFSPTDKVQIVPCIDEETGIEYYFIGTFLKKSGASTVATAYQPEAVSPTEQVPTSMAAPTAAVEKFISALPSETIDVLATVTKKENIDLSRPNSVASSRVKKEKAAPKNLEAEMQRVSTARDTGCDIRIKLPIVLILTGLSPATIYRRMKDENKLPFPKQQAKTGNESGAFWLLSDVDNYIGLQAKAKP